MKCRHPVNLYGGIGLLAGMALCLGGCMMGPNFKTPTAPSGAAFAPTSVTANVGGEGVAVQHFNQGQDIAGQWWTLFHSPALDALIKKALARNADLDAAHHALQEAWENVYAQQGGYWPSVDADYNASRNKTSSAYSSVASNDNYLYTLHTAQVSISYAPDLWGGHRRQVESLVAQADQQRFQSEAVYLTLTSNLVNAAIQAASLRAQVDAAESAIQSEQAIYDTLSRQRQLGDVADSDIAAQQAVLAQTRASLPPLQKQLSQQHDLIAALSGGMPNEATPVFDLDTLHLPTDLPVSLPAQVIEHRPDVRQAQAAWHAACAQVGVAAADRLPTISLSAAWGGASDSIHRLFSSGGGFWSVGADVAQPIFDGGTLMHQERAAREAYQQAGAAYRSVVITAFQNVADSLHAIQFDTDALAASTAAEQAAARSLDIAQKQLLLGDVSKVTVQQAIQSLAQTRTTLVQAQAARYADTVALFQALGGGWWNRDDALSKR